MTISLTCKWGPLKYVTFSGPLYTGSGTKINCTVRKKNHLKIITCQKFDNSTILKDYSFLQIK